MIVEISINALNLLPEILKKMDLSPPFTVSFTPILNNLHHVIGLENNFIPVENCDIKTIETLKQTAKNSSAILGFGGGSALDVAKFSAFQLDLPFISVPTLASNDGIGSPISVVTQKNGKSKSIVSKQPDVIVADLGMISKAPIRFLRAGIGDLLSNLSSVEDYLLAGERTGENIDKESIQLAKKGAMDLLNEPKHSQNHLEVLLAGLIAGGKAMVLAGSSRPCSGGEHQIAHVIEENMRTGLLHGELVAMGTWLCLQLRNNPIAKQVENYFTRWKVPFRPHKLGINKTQLIKILKMAPTIRNHRYTILSEQTESQILDFVESTF